MTDFDFDCKEKKRIAQGAYHRKNGSKSKGCHLPHEDLTAAEQKKLNGPVKTVDLDRPMTWKALKALPEDKRKLYLERLMDLYGVSKNKLARMLGIAPGYLCQVCAQMRLDVNRGKHYHMTKQQDAMWEAFCGGVVGGKPGEPKPGEPKPEEPKPEGPKPEGPKPEEPTPCLRPRRSRCENRPRRHSCASGQLCGIHRPPYRA